MCLMGILEFLVNNLGRVKQAKMSLKLCLETKAYLNLYQAF